MNPNVDAQIFHRSKLVKCCTILSRFRNPTSSSTEQTDPDWVRDNPTTAPTHCHVNAPLALFMSTGWCVKNLVLMAKPHSPTQRWALALTPESLPTKRPPPLQKKKKHTQKKKQQPSSCLHKNWVYIWKDSFVPSELDPRQKGESVDGGGALGAWICMDGWDMKR